MTKTRASDAGPVDCLDWSHRVNLALHLEARLPESMRAEKRTKLAFELAESLLLRGGCPICEPISWDDFMTSFNNQ